MDDEAFYAYGAGMEEGHKMPQSTITALVEALKFSRTALQESAHLLRPTYPSIANNVIGAHINIIDNALSKAQREGEG